MLTEFKKMAIEDFALTGQVLLPILLRVEGLIDLLGKMGNFGGWWLWIGKDGGGDGAVAEGGGGWGGVGLGLVLEFGENLGVVSGGEVSGGTVNEEAIGIVEANGVEITLMGRSPRKQFQNSCVAEEFEIFNFKGGIGGKNFGLCGRGKGLNKLGLIGGDCLFCLS